MYFAQFAGKGSRQKSGLATAMLVLVLLAVFACSRKKSSPVEASAPVYEFSGIKQLLPNPDGTYYVLWDEAPVPGVTYTVFSRMGAKSFNLNAPESTTTFNFHKSKDLRPRQESTCFLVRMSYPGEGRDLNTRELCTEGKIFKGFAGLSRLTKNEDGSYLLGWEPIPVDGVRYSVFIDGKQDPGVMKFDETPLETTTDVLFKTSVLAIGEKHCFAVRYVKEDFPSDRNETKLCTDSTQSSDFLGINDAKPANTGSARVTWIRSKHPDVVGYKVYKGTSFTEDNLVYIGNRDESEAFIDSLIPDQEYEFGVRAFDKYGRTDTNRQTLKMRVANLFPPKFEGVKTGVIKSPGSISLSWSHARGVPAKYNVYMGSAELGQAPVVEFARPYKSVPAPANEVAVTGLGDDRIYRFVVRAESALGLESQWDPISKGGAEEPQVTVTAPDAGPPFFKGLSSVTLDDGHAVLSWNLAVGQVTNYKILMWPQSGNESQAFTLPMVAGSYSKAVLSCDPVSDKEPEVKYIEPGDFEGSCPLQGNSQYKFKLKAYDRHSGVDSNAVELPLVVGDLQRPVLSGLPTALAIEENKMHISFTPAPDVDIANYIVFAAQFSPSSGQFSAQAEKLRVAKSHCDTGSSWLSAGVCTIVVDGLSLSAKYKFLVRAVDTAGNRSLGDTSVIETTRASSRPEFAGVRGASQDNTTPSTVVLSWDKPLGGVSRYQVFYSTNYQEISLYFAGLGPLPVNRADNVVPASACAGTVCKFGITGLVAGTKQYFAVRTFDTSTREEEDINTVILGYIVPNTTPPTFAGIQAASLVADTANPALDTARLTWNVTNNEGSINDQNEYVIYQQSGGSGPFLETARVRRGESQTTIRGLKDNTTFAFRVRTRNTNGYEDTNTNQAALYLPDRTPPTFSGGALSSAYNSNADNINVTWKAACDGVGGKGVKRYHVIWRASGAGVSFFANDTNRTFDGARTKVVNATAACPLDDADTSNDNTVVTQSTTLGTSDGLLRNTAYEFLVVAEDLATGPDNVSLVPNFSKNVEPSNISVFPPTASAPTFAGLQEVILETADLGSGNTRIDARLRWAPIVDGTFYKVEVSTDAGSTFSVLTSTLAAGTASYLVSAISDVTSYCYRVTARNDYNLWSTAGAGITFANLGFSDVTCATSKKTPDFVRPVFPNQSTNVTAAAPAAARKVVLSWGTQATDNVGLVKYELYKRTAVSAASGSLFNYTSPLIANIASSATTVDIDAATYGLAQGSIYDFQLIAVDARGNKSLPTATDYVTVTYRSDNVPIVDSPATISPGTNVKSGDTITCTVAYSDLDGDLVVPTFRFYNGASLREAVAKPAGATQAIYRLKTRADVTSVTNADVRGNVLRCEVTLLDSQARSVVSNSASVTLVDSAPVISVADMASQTVETAGALSPVTLSVFDADGDSLSIVKVAGQDSCSVFAAGPFGVTTPGGTDYGTRTASLTGTALGALTEALPAQSQVCSTRFVARSNVSGTDVDSSAFALVQTLVVNKAPVEASLSVTITPATASTSTDLTCQITTTSDPESQALTYTYQWFEGAVLSSAQVHAVTPTPVVFTPTGGTYTANVLSAGAATSTNTVIGNTYWCVVTVSDGRAVSSASPGFGKITKSAARKITPDTPTISNITSGSTTGKVGNTLRCNLSSVDAATGAQVTSKTHQWFTEVSPGSSTFLASVNTSVIEGGITKSALHEHMKLTVADAHRKVYCRITISSVNASGQTISSIADSGTMDSADSAPVLSALALPAGPHYAGGSVSVNLSATDADGDVISYTKVTDTCGIFTLSGAAISGVLPSSAVVHSATHAGVCQASVQASANGVLSGSQTLSVTVTNRAPTLTCTPLTQAVDEGLAIASVSCTPSDPDVGAFAPIMSLPAVSNVCGLSISGTTVSGNMPSMADGVTQCQSTLKAIDALDATLISAPATLTLSFPATRSLDLTLAGTVSLDNSCGLQIGGSCTGNAGNTCAVSPAATGTLTRVAGSVAANLSGVSGTVTDFNLGGGASLLATWKVFGSNGAVRTSARTLTLTQAAATLLRSSDPSSQLGLDASSGKQVTFSGCLGTSCSSIRGTLAGKFNHQCAITPEATSGVGDTGLKCWGENVAGSVSTTPVASPTPVATPVAATTNGSTALTGLLGLAAGGGHTCVVTSAGGVKCWGQNGSGQLGDATATNRATPVGVQDLSYGVSALAAGEKHTCSLLLSGAVKCWGEGISGRLGTGNEDQQSIPTSVVDLDGLTPAKRATSVSAGLAHTCAVMLDGKIKCWGLNDYGQLGKLDYANASAPQASSVFTGASAPLTAVAVDTGHAHTCALSASGAVHCWGKNTFGSLGINSETNQNSPTEVTTLNPSAAATRAVALAAGGNHSCAITQTGAVYCWGSNSRGQLGRSSVGLPTCSAVACAKVPTAVAYIDGLTLGSRAVALSAGAEHTCALMASGTTRCWGSDQQGQLGNNASLADIAVVSGTTAVAGGAFAVRSCNVYNAN